MIKNNDFDYSELISEAIQKVKEFLKINSDFIKSDIYYSVKNKEVTITPNPGDTFLLYSWISLDEVEPQIMKRYYSNKINDESNLNYFHFFSGQILYPMIDNTNNSDRYYDFKFNVQHYSSLFTKGILRENINNDSIYSELISDIIDYSNSVIENEYLFVNLEHSHNDILKIVSSNKLSEVTGKLKLVYFKIWLEKEKEQL